MCDFMRWKAEIEGVKVTGGRPLTGSVRRAWRGRLLQPHHRLLSRYTTSSANSIPDTMQKSAQSSAIATAHLQCVNSFEDLLDAASLTSEPPGWNTAAINSVFTRYNMWAGNMGAMNSGQEWKKSLDYRLREASFYQAQVWNTS
jgi:hypothetical protein